MKKFHLPTLDYSLSSLEPIISSTTVDLHYNRHHNTYCMTLNKLLEESNVQIDDTTDNGLMNLMIESYGDSKKVGIFNNAGQVFNHNFYWASITDKAKNIGNGVNMKLNRNRPK